VGEWCAACCQQEEAMGGATRQVRVRATLRQRWPLFRDCHDAAYNQLLSTGAHDHVSLQQRTCEEETTLIVLLTIRYRGRSHCTQCLETPYASLALDAGEGVTVTEGGAYSHSLPSAFEPKASSAGTARGPCRAAMTTISKRALTALAATAHRRYTWHPTIYCDPSYTTIRPLRQTSKTRAQLHTCRLEAKCSQIHSLHTRSEPRTAKMCSRIQTLPRLLSSSVDMICSMLLCLS